MTKSILVGLAVLHSLHFRRFGCRATRLDPWPRGEAKRIYRRDEPKPKSPLRCTRTHLLVAGPALRLAGPAV